VDLTPAAEFFGRSIDEPGLPQGRNHRPQRRLDPQTRGHDRASFPMLRYSQEPSGRTGRIGPRGSEFASVGGGRDRPEAACPPDCRTAAGEAGGFNAVQKLLTNRRSRQTVKAESRQVCSSHLSHSVKAASCDSVKATRQDSGDGCLVCRSGCRTPFNPQHSALPNRGSSRSSAQGRRRWTRGVKTGSSEIAADHARAPRSPSGRRRRILTG
jgi:hypothetical protein